MYTKDELKIGFNKVLKKWFFPDFTNKLTWLVVIIGSGILVFPNPFKIYIFNWLLTLLNQNIEGLQIPKIDDGPDYYIGLILILAALVHNILYKYFETNRNIYEMNVEGANKDKKEKTLSLIGVLENDILKCWEQATMYANMAKFGKQDAKMESVDEIILANYETLKLDLINLGVISPKLWNELDRLPKSVDDINNALKKDYKIFVFIKCYHFSEQCKSLWGIMSIVYLENGGDINDLTTPMPIPINLD